MLTTIISLLLLGLIMLFAEAILPGGIVGFFGGLAIVGSAVLCFKEYGSGTGTLYLVGCLVASGIVGFGAFFYFTRRMALNPTPLSDAVDPRLGKTARVVKPLAPTGMVEVEGKRYQAHSESSEIAIAEGAEVTITGIDSTFLVVRENA